MSNQEKTVDVSIIVLLIILLFMQLPVHNAEEFLDECFEGIDKQTYKGSMEVFSHFNIFIRFLYTMIEVQMTPKPSF